MNSKAIPAARINQIMKHRLLILIFVFLGSLTSHANTSNEEAIIKDYILGFGDFAGDRTLYSGDRLLRLDIDLDHDGQPEMLLSMARLRDGGQGNLWSVYQKKGSNFAPSRA